MSKAAFIDGEVYVISDEDVPHEAHSFLRSNGSLEDLYDCQGRWPERKEPRPCIANFYLTETRIGFGVGTVHARRVCACQDCMKRTEGHVKSESCIEVELTCSSNHHVSVEWYRAAFDNRIVVNGISSH